MEVVSVSLFLPCRYYTFYYAKVCMQSCFYTASRVALALLQTRSLTFAITWCSPSDLVTM
jgi:hypothetical protein